MNKNNSMVITIVVAVIVAAIAFFGGMKYEQGKTTQMGNGSQVAAGAGRNGGFGGGAGARGAGGRNGAFGGGTIGQVVSVDSNSITVKLQDGSSKIVNLSSSTSYMKMDTASVSDIKTGDRIAAIGQTNSDGSVDAQMIQLNPPQRMGRGGTAGQSAQPSPTQ